MVTEETLKKCDHCREDIDVGASVCKHCEKHQGILGKINAATIVVGFVVSVIMTLFTFYNAYRTQVDKSEVKQALELAREASSEARKASFEVKEARDVARRAYSANAKDSLELSIKSLIKDIGEWRIECGYSKRPKVPHSSNPTELQAYSDALRAQMRTCGRSRNQVVDSASKFLSYAHSYAEDDPSTIAWGCTQVTENIPKVMGSGFDNQLVKLGTKKQDFKKTFDDVCGPTFLSPPEDPNS